MQNDHAKNQSGADVPSTALLGDPFVELSLEQIRAVRNEAINRSYSDEFKMYGFTFIIPAALFRANSRLMAGGHTPNADLERTERSGDTLQDFAGNLKKRL